MKKVILAGNPNTGKTTLFNTLTKSSERASNWHGVTVSVKTKKTKINNEEYEVSDLPGLYSLDTYSEEEKIAEEFLTLNQDATVVCIVDANNLRRNLYLAMELKERHLNVIIAVNMASEVKGIDYKKLEELLNMKIALIDAKSKKGIRELEKLITTSSFEKQKIEVKPKANEVFSLKDFQNKAASKFKQIDIMLNASSYKTKCYLGYSKIDNFLLNPFWSLVVFALVMGLVFFITFGSVGAFLSDVISSGFEYLQKIIVSLLNKTNLSVAVIDFINGGVLGSILTILTFMPQIILLFLSLNFLEDVGYLSRVAFMFDGYLKYLGLTGKSVFSLLMGFGCTTTAVMTTRNLDSTSLKKRTAILLPFMSCSAKLPIFALICSAFFTKYKVLIVLALYMFAILIMILVALILKRFTLKKDDGFVLEMPAYRLPYMKKVLKNALTSSLDFLTRVSGILLLSGMIVYLLSNFSFSFKYVPAVGGTSMLEGIALKLSPVFKPLGFSMAGAVVALLSGLIAKEMVVSSLCIVNGVSLSGLALSLLNPSSNVHFTCLSALSFLVFILFYPPCISAFASMRREIGLKSTILSFIFQIFVAYVCSLAVYNIGRLILLGLWWVALLIVIFLALLIFVVLKCAKKKKLLVKQIKCSNCKEKCNGSCY